jgi:hypothetical protein
MGFDLEVLRGAMGLNEERRTAVAYAQETEYREGYDYAAGSPHIRHDRLRELLESKIDNAIHEVLARQHSCAVLEVGAGHGSLRRLSFARVAP